MSRGRVAVVTLGCGRNEVDSDQVAGALTVAGFDLVDDAEEADCVLVNTCTFIAPAREESIATILQACDLPAKVLVIGCMAERYGRELADALPEAAGVIGFAEYERLPDVVAAVLAGEPVSARRHAPGGPASAGPAPSATRRSLPLLPVDAADAGNGTPPAQAGQPGPHSSTPPARASQPRPHSSMPTARASQPGPHTSAPLRPSTVTAARRAPQAPPTAAFPVRTAPRGPWAYMKIAGGCDRACTFCTIPSYRGRFASRPVEELLAEARWLARQGVRELVCVSENTTSYGKDLPGGRGALVELVRGFERVEGLERVRLLYLQPAELTAQVLDALAASPVAAAYYDLSLQHASATVLRGMGRSGSRQRFVDLVGSIRARDPAAVFRSSFICGFPGETEADVEEIERLLVEARLDWTGFFLFSPEDGTPAARMPDQVPEEVARQRRDHLLPVAEAVAEENAAAFVGAELDVLVEQYEGSDALGRSHREAPETDGEVRLVGCEAPVGRLVRARVVGADGVDLVATPLGGLGR